MTYSEMIANPGTYKAAGFNCIFEVDDEGVGFRPSMNLLRRYPIDDTWVNETFLPVNWFPAID